MFWSYFIISALFLIALILQTCVCSNDLMIKTGNQLLARNQIGTLNRFVKRGTGGGPNSPKPSNHTLGSSRSSSPQRAVSPTNKGESSSSNIQPLSPKKGLGSESPQKSKPLRFEGYIQSLGPLKGVETIGRTREWKGDHVEKGEFESYRHPILSAEPRVIVDPKPPKRYVEPRYIGYRADEAKPYL